MLRCLVVAAIAIAMAGCSGEYILTAPEQVAPAGGAATLVARLQRREFSAYTPAVADTAISFRVQEGAVRGAYTDKEGYAAAIVPVPSEPAKYFAGVNLTDKNGRQQGVFSPVYVLDPRRPAVVVDLEALAGQQGWPALGRYNRLDGAGTDRAREAMAKLFDAGMNIIYLTRRPNREIASLHAQLRGGGFPDGAILQWQHEDWRVVGEGLQTRVVVESRLVSQLPALRKMLPGLTVGVCDTEEAARTFAQAGLKYVIVGPAPAPAPGVTRRANWQDLAAKGLR